MFLTKLDASQYLIIGKVYRDGESFSYLAARFIASDSRKLDPIFFTSFVGTIETQDGEEADGRIVGGGSGGVVGDWPSYGDDP